MPTKLKATKQALDHVRSQRTRTILNDARDAGLLDGEKSEHLSFRAPAALIEAARRETGIHSPTELGILALATLAQSDPVVEYIKHNYGALGKSHDLEF